MPARTKPNLDVKFPPELVQQMRLYRRELRFNLFTGVKFPPKFPKPSITYWEQLTCVGYNPMLSLLEAVVSIKQPTGYGGDLCSSGSKEYIRFFVDWGSGFQHVGLTSFEVHDISDAPPGLQHPLEYMVFFELDDKERRKCCFKHVLPKVRAVLSWHVPPTLDPNDMPPFGNHIDANIQLKPRPLSLACLFDEFIVDPNIINKMKPILTQIDLNSDLTKVKPKPVPVKELAIAYKKASVPDHRLVYELVQPMLQGTHELHMPAVIADTAVLKELKIDLQAVAEKLKVIPQPAPGSVGKKNADISYEELTCLGLQSSTDVLGGVIHVKKPYGYSGSLCQGGSLEYVAFWADWNNDGAFDEYLGTASVEAHDFYPVPAEGLSYSVTLPSNFYSHLKTCGSPNIVRIRGVLSWAVPPSTTDPNALNYWGNSLDVLVQLRPTQVPPSQNLIDLIYDVGNVSLPNISPVTFLAFPAPVALASDQCNSGPWDRPFGGWVRIGGRIYNTGSAGSVYFQVQYAPHGTTNWQPVTTSVTFELMHPLPWDPKYPQEYLTFTNTEGWFPYMEDPTTSPPIFERTALLSWWYTGGLSGLYDLRLNLCVGDPNTTGVKLPLANKFITIMIDNHGFTISPTPNTTLDKSYDLDLIITGGDCHNYIQSIDNLSGKLHALSDNFWKWEFDLQPESHTHHVNADPPCRSYVSLVDNGDNEVGWTLQTASLDKCGYTLTLWAYDRTIVDSNGAIVHWNRKAVGFSVT
jgi:hypothetical protein